LEIIASYPLLALNTLALPAKAEFFCRIETMEDIQQALSFAEQRQLPVTVLGGGSNIVLAGDLAGLVVQVALLGISIEAQEDNTVLVTAGAGEVWHNFVRNMLAQQCYGLENLSLIPGLVGAAPVQNIGAYGVELSDCFVALDAIDIASGEVTHFTRQDCQFAYRHSIFKTHYRDAYLITAITLRLQREPAVESSYPALREALASYSKTDLTPQLISETICQIRREKLPDPALEPNVGSFFKNPLLSSTQAETLAAQYADLVMYPQADGQVKIPAAWLIERAGWKGVTTGCCGVHKHHALVLTHSSNANGRDLLKLAEQIVADIRQRFNIELEMEPRVLGGNDR